MNIEIVKVGYNSVAIGVLKDITESYTIFYPKDLVRIPSKICLLLSLLNLQIDAHRIIQKLRLIAENNENKNYKKCF